MQTVATPPAPHTPPSRPLLHTGRETRLCVFKETVTSPISDTTYCVPGLTSITHPRGQGRGAARLRCVVLPMAHLGPVGVAGKDGGRGCHPKNPGHLWLS